LEALNHERAIQFEAAHAVAGALVPHEPAGASGYWSAGEPT
jgi:hypothetical protein